MTETTDKKIEDIIDGTDTEHIEKESDCCCGDADAKHMTTEESATDEVSVETENVTVDETSTEDVANHTESTCDCGCGDVHEKTTPEFDVASDKNDASTTYCYVCTDDSDKSRADVVKEKATEAFEAAGDAVSKAGENIATAAHAAADEFDTDEAKDAVKSIAHGAVTVGKNFAGAAKKFVTTLVSHDEKNDGDMKQENAE